MKLLLVACSLSVVLFGCATGGPDIGPGLIFSSVDGPIMATTAEKASKSGEACAMNILGLVAVGDNSIEAAKKNGGIKVVSSADYNMLSILGFFSKKCTRVKGTS
jgi:hypothetical protein